MTSNLSVYARVSPENKIRIVDAWQKRGKIVSMTGDVADVKAGVEAGARIATEQGVLINTEVIANPHPELWEAVL